MEICKSKNSLDTESDQSVIFKSKDLSLQLLATIDCGEDSAGSCPILSFKKKSMKSDLGEAVTARVSLKEGQAISFVLREHETANDKEHVTSAVLDKVQHDSAYCPVRDG